jgi:hypothetical protein
MSFQGIKSTTYDEESKTIDNLNCKKKFVWHDAPKIPSKDLRQAMSGGWQPIETLIESLDKMDNKLKQKTGHPTPEETYESLSAICLRINNGLSWCHLIDEETMPEGYREECSMEETVLLEGNLSSPGPLRFKRSLFRRRENELVAQAIWTIPVHIRLSLTLEHPSNNSLASTGSSLDTMLTKVFSSIQSSIENGRGIGESLEEGRKSLEQLMRLAGELTVEPCQSTFGSIDSSVPAGQSTLQRDLSKQEYDSPNR